MRRHRSQFWPRIACSLALSLSVLACDSGTEESSPDDAKTTAGKSGSKSSTGGKGGKGGAGGSKAASGGKGGEGGAGGTKSEAGSGGKSESEPKGGSGGKAAGADGCFEGEPKQNDQFLNHCTESQCEPFDNAKRLPLYNNGDLPKLP